MSMKVDNSISNNNIFAPKSKAQKSSGKDAFQMPDMTKEPVSAKDSVSSVSLFKVENEVPGQPKLSDKAMKLLDKLKSQYGDKMDFMIFEKGQDPKKMLPYATKEYAVFFSREEIEKMAADEDYEKENMDKIMKAVDMADSIVDKFKDDPEKANMIHRIGITFNSDGSIKLFADLEKATKQQSETLEKIRDKRAEEKKTAKLEAEKDKQELAKAKAAEKKKAEHPRSGTMKRTTLEADSMEELIEKITNFNWDDTEEELMVAGRNFNMKA